MFLLVKVVKRVRFVSQKHEHARLCMLFVFCFYDMQKRHFSASDAVEMPPYVSAAVAC